MSKTLFEKIIDREIPGDIIYEDEHCIAFRDISPTAPVHVLLVPRKPIASLSAATDDDQTLLGHLMRVAPRIAADNGVGDAYRTVINTGAKAGQSVFHLHLHIIGGRPMDWPPG